MSNAVVTARTTVAGGQAFVLFRIGMRFNGVRGFWNALRVFARMPGMLAELERDRALGLLSTRVSVSLPVIELTQFWRSYDDLERYAAARDNKHAPTWAWFNKLGASGHGAGIWHETYRIAPGAYEAIYVNMPPYGLAKALGSHLVAPNEARSRARLESACPVEPTAQTVTP